MGRKLMVLTVAVLLTVVLVMPMAAQAGQYSPAGMFSGFMIYFEVPMVLMGAHDCAYYGGFGCTPNASYVAYVDTLNNAWRTQKHYDKFGVEYTPKESKGWDSPAQEAYYAIR